MNPIERYLDVLGLKRGASKADLKSAYRALIQIAHPDRFQDNETLKKKAEEQTRLLNESYQYLSKHFEEMSRPAPRDAPRSAPDRSSTGPPDDRTGRARREEEKKRQDAEYQKRKALREAREAQRLRWEREQGRHDRQTVILGVVFVILLILYATYARRNAPHRRIADVPTEAVEMDPE